MELLNSEELKNIKGGANIATELAAKCDKAGDVVIPCTTMKVVACAAYVLKCPSTFSSDCSSDGKVTISGCPTVTLKP
ncbi:MAG: hypothetical protein LBT27_08835 [Prevotellaceae bacterium]|nr:hypothetical protein [Prevotellaceae bacterium]